MIFQKLIVLLLLLLTHIVYSQNKEDVVYAGRNFNWGLNMGSYDLSILIRADGTFCEDLAAQDWQTKIAGRHKRIKDNIVLEYLDNTVENDTIFMEKDEDGYVFVYYGGAQMVKMSTANNVPPGYYKFSSASSSGGMGTGMVYVGTQSYEGFNFYEDGTFDTNSSGGVMISGNAIGGGSSREDQGAGTYTIKNSLLTLFFSDGHIEKHSFFYDVDGGKDFLVALDGSIFFYETESEEPVGIAAAKDTMQSIRALPASAKAKELLMAVKETHGGTAIDELRTLEAEATISGMNFRILLDQVRTFVRLESLEPSFNYLEQLEGESGWVLQNGSYSIMSDQRIRELKSVFICGVFGLQNAVLEKSNVLNIIENQDDFVLVQLEIDETELGYVIQTKDNSLAATLVLKEGQKEVTYLSEFKMVDKIKLPFKEITVTNDATIEVIYKSYLLNPLLTNSDWSKNP